MKTHPSRFAGMSLIEMMITLSIAAIVLAIAAPAFSSWVRNIVVRSTAESLQAALQSARSEAVVRNAVVRLNLSDETGRPSWSLVCVRVSVNCPAVIRQFFANGAEMARIGINPGTATTSIDTPLAVGNGLPAGISFNAMGGIAGANASSDIARIDVMHADSSDARRLVLLVEGAGMIRLCDPSIASGMPGGCS